MTNTLLVVSIAIILILGIGGIVYITGENQTHDKELNDAFSLGYNKSLVDVAQGQSQTGTLIFWVNNSIKVISAETLCNGLK
jgi:hypothetical protein